MYDFFSATKHIALQTFCSLSNWTSHVYSNWTLRKFFPQQWKLPCRNLLQHQARSIQYHGISLACHWIITYVIAELWGGNLIHNSFNGTVCLSLQSLLQELSAELLPLTLKYCFGHDCLDVCLLSKESIAGGSHIFNGHWASYAQG